jgi:hypothetical protein
MKDLWSTAERLRTVNQARKRFLTLWALDQSTRLFERQWRRNRIRSADVPTALAPSADAVVLPVDWKRLYRGSVLDD